MIRVVIDIESVSRLSDGVFLAVFCAQFEDGHREKQSFYFKINVTDYEGTSTYDWWNSDPARKTFFDSCMETCSKFDRAEVTKKMRNFVDYLYSFNQEVVFYSDFAVFDIGQVNTLLEKEACLPIYMKNDESYPAECVDYTTYVKGVAHMDVTDSSNKAFEKLGLTRKKMCASHDTEIDVDLIMDNVVMVEERTKRARYEEEETANKKVLTHFEQESS